MMAGQFFTTEIAYDIFNLEFTQIVNLSEIILPCILASHDGIAPLFHVGIGIVAALYLVGSRCRLDTVRQRAIEMLFSANYREGIWDAMAVALIARWIRGIELEGMEADGTIPEDKRVFLSAINVDLYHRREMLGVTQRTKDGPVERKTVIEW
jgi:hypothetical protein